MWGWPMADRLGIRFALAETLWPSFTRGGKRCLREGSRKHGRRVPTPEHTVQLVPPAEHWDWAFVFRVSLGDDVLQRWPGQPQSYWVIARSREAVESYLQKRYTNIARQYLGTMRFSLGEAMAKISTRPSASGRLGTKADKVGRREIFVRSFDGADGYTVEVADTLHYAAHAFQRGRAEIAYAMKKAANSIAGRLRKVGEHILDADLQTPFPEVKGRRRSA